MSLVSNREQGFPFLWTQIGGSGCAGAGIGASGSWASPKGARSRRNKKFSSWPYSGDATPLRKHVDDRPC